MHIVEVQHMCNDGILSSLQGMPMLSPFVPIYKALPSGAIPQALQTGGPNPDALSLFWKVRRLQAVVSQNFKRLLPPAEAAIIAWEKHVEERLMPAMELRYAAALARKNPVAARQELTKFTAKAVASASILCEQLTKQAAKGLGLDRVPDDVTLVKWLDAAGKLCESWPAGAGIAAPSYICWCGSFSAHVVSLLLAKLQIIGMND